MPHECDEGEFFDDSVSQCVAERLVVSPSHCTQTTEEAGGEHSDFGATTEATRVNGESKASTEAGGEECDSEASITIGNSTFEGEGDNSTLTPISGHMNATGNCTDAAEILETEDQPRNETTDEDVSVELSFCDHLDNVERYSSLVIGTPPLTATYQYEEDYNRIVQDYNDYLDRAKNNTFTWRQGDSILNGLKKTYQLAREYGTEFQRKLNVNKGELVRLSTAKINKKYTQNLQDDIKNLEESIREIEQTLTMVSEPGVRSFFRRTLESKRREIEEKKQAMKSNTRVGRLLKEQVSFLGYVMKDAEEIENLSGKWLLPMETLLNNLRDDNEAFMDYFEKTRNTTDALNQTIETLQEKLKKNDKKQDKLEEEKKLLDAEVLTLTEESEKLAQENLELIKEMEKKTTLYNKQKESICKPEGVIKDFIHENSSISDIETACNELLEARSIFLDISAEQDQLDQQRAESKSNRAKVTLKLEEIKTITAKLDKLFQQVYPKKRKIEEIRMELISLDAHATDLRNLEEGSKAAIASLITIKNEFQLVSEPFAILASDFQSLIDQANAISSDDEIRSQMEAIEEAMNDVQVKLEQVHLPDTEPCFD